LPCKAPVKDLEVQKTKNGKSQFFAFIPFIPFILVSLIFCISRLRLAIQDRRCRVAGWLLMKSKYQQG